MLPVLLMPLFLGGCGRDRLSVLASQQAEAAQVPSALAVADEERRIGQTLPDYPARCRQKHRAGVKAGDRLDAATLKYDRALAASHRQIDACAAWYDNLKAGIAGGVQ